LSYSGRWWIHCFSQDRSYSNLSLSLSLSPLELSSCVAGSWIHPLWQTQLLVSIWKYDCKVHHMQLSVQKRNWWRLPTVRASEATAMVLVWSDCYVSVSGGVGEMFLSGRLMILSHSWHSFQTKRMCRSSIFCFVILDFVGASSSCRASQSVCRCNLADICQLFKVPFTVSRSLFLLLNLFFALQNLNKSMTQKARHEWRILTKTNSR